MNWKDVRRIFLTYSSKISVNWPAIAQELTALAEKEDKSILPWQQLTWEEREERIRAICQEEIEKAKNEATQ
jgi:hypothetical protein